MPARLAPIPSRIGTQSPADDNDSHRHPANRREVHTLHPPPVWAGTMRPAVHSQMPAHDSKDKILRDMRKDRERSSTKSKGG